MEARTCLVTGAGRGIGRVIAARLSETGNRVAVTARSTAELSAAAASMRGPVLELGTDVAGEGAAEEVFAAVEQRWGPTEVLVLNAGTATSAPLVSTTDQEWAHALEINLTAPFRFLRRAVPAMVERGWGRIIVIASMAAKRGDPYISAYTASKHGVLGLVRSAAAELATTGVTVNAVCPGFVDTPMTQNTIGTITAKTGRSMRQARSALENQQPIGRLINPAEVADIVELCVRNAAINGQGINVDGGAVQS